ncbi:hypothetical protein V8E53_003866 [Lactarius tabidus]
MLTSQCRQPRCRLKTCNALVALRAHLLGVALSARDTMVACCGRVKNERTPITLREEGYAKGMKEARRRSAQYVVLAQICNRTRLALGHHDIVATTVRESVEDSINDGPRRYSRSASLPDAPTGSRLRAEREEREGAQGLPRPHLHCPIRIRTVQPRLILLLREIAGYVFDDKSEYIVVGIKTSYMCSAPENPDGANYETQVWSIAKNRQTPVAPALFNDQGHTRKFMCRVPWKIGVPPPDRGNVMQGQERTGEPVGSRDAGRASSAGKGVRCATEDRQPSLSYSMTSASLSPAGFAAPATLDITKRPPSLDDRRRSSFLLPATAVHLTYCCCVPRIEHNDDDDDDDLTLDVIIVSVAKNKGRCYEIWTTRNYKHPLAPPCVTRPGFPL